MIIHVQSVKYHLCLALLACLSIPGVMAQTAAPTTSPDIYAMAVRAAAEEKARAYSKLKGYDLFNLVFRKGSTTDRLPAEIGHFHLTVLDYNGLRDRYRDHGTFAVSEVFPARIDGTGLRVNITDSWYSYRNGFIFHRGSHMFAEEGGAEVFFRYDCEKQGFVVDHVSLWGI